MTPELADWSQHNRTFGALFGQGYSAERGLLYDLYITEGRSVDQISRILGRSYSQVRDRLLSHQINLRTHGRPRAEDWPEEYVTRATELKQKISIKGTDYLSVELQEGTSYMVADTDSDVYEKQIRARPRTIFRQGELIIEPYKRGDLITISHKMIRLENKEGQSLHVYEYFRVKKGQG